MFDTIQKLGTIISAAVLTMISSIFGVKDINMTLPQPSPTLVPISQFESTPLPTSKLSIKPTIKPTPKPVTAAPAVTKAAEPSISWKNVNEGSTYTVDQTIPVELDIHGTDVAKVEFTVGSDFHVCTVEAKPYACTLKLDSFFHGITGKQSFPIQAKIYTSQGTIVYKNAVIYVSP